MPSTLHRHRRTVLAALALVASSTLAACGGGQQGTATASGNPPTFTLIATDNKWDQSSYSAKAGSITIGMRNQGSVSHSIVLRDASGTRLVNRILVSPGRGASVDATLAAGTYAIVCDVPGHEATMHAQLVVT